MFNTKKNLLLLFIATIYSCKQNDNADVQSFNTVENYGDKGCTPQMIESRARSSRMAGNPINFSKDLAFGDINSGSGTFALTENSKASQKDSRREEKLTADPCSEILAAKAQKIQSKTIQNGIVAIAWRCSGRGKQIAGGLKQDEYCEWERVKREENSALKCRFTSSFDHSRKYYLTQREKDSLWADTQFNSFAFLAGGSEIDGNTRRRGIINHCLKKSCGAADIEDSKYFGNCVPDRASDPEICNTLNAAVSKNSCAVSAVTSEVVNANPNKISTWGANYGDRSVKLMLHPDSDTFAGKYCKHIIDPAFEQKKPFDPAEEATLLECDIPDSEKSVTSCDDVAQFIVVRAAVNLSQCK